MEFVLVEPVTKKLKEAPKDSGVVSGVDDGFVVISPKVCGYWMAKSDSLISSAEVVMGVFQGALQQVDFDMMERKDDMSNFVGAFHDSLVVGPLPLIYFLCTNLLCKN